MGDLWKRNEALCIQWIQFACFVVLKSNLFQRFKQIHVNYCLTAIQSIHQTSLCVYLTEIQIQYRFYLLLDVLPLSNFHTVPTGPRPDLDFVVSSSIFLQENGTQIATTQKPVVIYRNLQFIKQLKQLLFCGILAIFCGPRHNNTHGILQRSCGRRGSRWGIYGLTVLGHSTWPGLWTSLAGTNVFISSD